ncbi:hypothetical protein IC582_013338 [Cucumis melo]
MHALPILHHCASPRSTKLHTIAIRAPQMFLHGRSPNVLAPRTKNVPPQTFVHGWFPNIEAAPTSLHHVRLRTSTDLLVPPRTTEDLLTKANWSKEACSETKFCFYKM